MRGSGILYPIFSLPSKFGIGCFSKEAFDFVDFLEEAGQTYWQILPIGPTSFGDSPYQPFSAFAGNPYFISPEKLIEEGLLTWEEAEAKDFGKDQEKVDYGALYENRDPLLKMAFIRWKEKEDKEEQEAYQKFLAKEKDWLLDYALFTAIKKQQKGASWLEWPDGLKNRDAAALKQAEEDWKEEIEFVYFKQYEFDKQWLALLSYAKKHHVKIIGDLPFYVALDSADAWSAPSVFQMNKEKPADPFDDESAESIMDGGDKKYGTPSVVAACPPDAFSADGQIWGNPVYDWEDNKQEVYEWWLKRIKRNYELYDILRFDHFHGFCEYFTVPYQAKNAKEGKHHKGPGMDFFNFLKKELGELKMIAEDLGTVTEENKKLLADSGLPGMKVLQFAFTSWDSDYVNHRHIPNCVVYTGTHDNTPTRAWIEEIGDGDRGYVRRYINSQNSDYGQFVWDLIREAYRSVADTCIIPIQDYLCKGKEARINTPGSPEGNWQWRMIPNFLSKDLCRSIRELADLYGRTPRLS